MSPLSPLSPRVTSHTMAYRLALRDCECSRRIVSYDLESLLLLWRSPPSPVPSLRLCACGPAGLRASVHAGVPACVHMKHMLACDARLEHRSYGQSAYLRLRRTSPESRLRVGPTRPGETPHHTEPPLDMDRLPGSAASKQSRVRRLRLGR